MSLKFPVLVLLAALLPAQALALKSDRTKPVRITAQKALINEKTGVSTYTGNVIVIQGTLKITAHVLTVYQKNRRLHRIVATGSPATFKQRPDNKPVDVRGRARNMEYLAHKDIVILKNRASLKQGGNTFRSNHIVYNLNTDQVKAAPGVGKGRVNITIQPATVERNGKKKNNKP
jgi:lipopolysaccharide export system protein LptA